MAISITAFGKAAGLSGAAVLALMSGSAFAQTTDSASVDAVATLQVVTPPLTVAGSQNLEFGTINIPNGEVSGNQCSYDIYGAASATTVRVLEIDYAERIVDSSFPFPSGCEATSTFNRARFAVQCNAATPTTVSLNLVGSSTPGISFRPSASTRMTALQKDAVSASIITTTGDTMVVVCPDGTASNSVAGAFDVIVGGSVILSELAAVGPEITIGTITLEAVY